jgi:hypothetical protein
MAATVVAAVVVPALVVADPAGAATRVSISLDGCKLPPGSLVTFSDVGGHCDGSKRYPTITVGRDDRYPDHGKLEPSVDLFTAKNTGSCAFEGSNAQFLVTVRTPSTAVGTTKLNLTQTGGPASSYVVHCYDAKGLDCYGDQRGNSPSGGQVSTYASLGPVTGSPTAAPAGYTFCAYENGSCSFTPSARASIAFGTDSTYRYTDRPFVGGGVKCTAAELGGDPTPGKPKACFYKIIGKK